MKRASELKSYLDSLVNRFEQADFILSDPIAIPHGFDDPRDQEVIGLYAALLAWGRRTIILQKMEELCERMRYHPFQFVYSFSEDRDAHRIAGFKYRTFQPLDTLWLTKSLSRALRTHGTIEKIFSTHLRGNATDTSSAVEGFSCTLLTALPGIPRRLSKHLARPSTGSACKRLNMYLRWCVRSGPVDLGIWETISPHQLILPLDVHSGRTARELGLLSRKQNDWQAALELTRNCRWFCERDPCRYDFAFFGPGAYGVSLDTRFTGTNKVVFNSSPIDR